MDNSEFEIRAFANPDDQSQDFLEALEQDPARKQFLEEVRRFDVRLNNIVKQVPAPQDLADKLKACALENSDEHSHLATVTPIRAPRPMQNLALAACLVLALGVTYSVLFTGNEPDSAELAFSQQVINHLYAEMDEVSASGAVNAQTINDVVAVVGGQLRSNEAVTNLSISFAKPCTIIPQNNSAHLALAGSQGIVNVIVVNNSPVQSEFVIDDPRFSGLVIPYEGGNLIIVGEKQESLGTYRDLLSENIDWVI